MCVLLGTTAAESKQHLVDWLDAVVSSVAATDTRVLDHRGHKVDGEYTGLRYNEAQDILSKLSGLSEWAADCITNRTGTVVEHHWSPPREDVAIHPPAQCCVDPSRNVTDCAI